MKLLDRVAETAARRHLSPLTVECYQRWIRDFLAYWAAPREKGDGRRESGEKDGAVRDGRAGEVGGDQAGAEVDITSGLLLDEAAVPPSKLNWRQPHELGAAEVAAFLTYLAVEVERGREVGDCPAF